MSHRWIGRPFLYSIAICFYLPSVVNLGLFFFSKVYIIEVFRTRMKNKTDQVHSLRWRKFRAPKLTRNERRHTSNSKTSGQLSNKEPDYTAGNSTLRNKIPLQDWSSARDIRVLLCIDCEARIVITFHRGRPRRKDAKE